MRLWLALPILAAVTACTASGQSGASIPIDHSGFAGRWRRACELGKATPTEGTCGPSEVPLESDESERDGSGEPDDSDASANHDAFDASGPEAVELNDANANAHLLEAARDRP